GKQVIGQQADVFGKHRKQQAVEEVRDRLRRVSALAQRLRQGGELLSGVLGDGRPRGARSQRFGVVEYGSERLPRLVVFQFVNGQPDFPHRRIGEVGADDDVLKVGHHQQRRVLQRVRIHLQLLVGAAKVFVCALGFPSEKALFPNI